MLWQKPLNVEKSVGHYSNPTIYKKTVGIAKAATRYTITTKAKAKQTTDSKTLLFVVSAIILINLLFYVPVFIY